jgi:pyridoxine kinase
MKTVLSIQSHVAKGYVGNRMAVFALERLGIEALPVNTVQFSNHTGYGKFRGDVFSKTHIEAVIEGLFDNGALPKVDAILSGYQGSPEIGSVIIDVVKRIKSLHPDTVYCCDPVMGDIGRGLFVKPEVAEFIKEQVIYSADIITPNEFELGYLAGKELSSKEAVIKACDALHDEGISLIVVTSLSQGLLPNEIGMLLSAPTGKWQVTTPRFHFEKSLHGSGDLTSAIFLAHYLRGENVVTCLEQTIASLYKVFEYTFDKGTYELAIIETQEEITQPSYRVKAIKL